MIHSCVFDTCNKKMSLVPFTFKNVELYVVTVNGKHWTRAKEVCKALEYQRRTKDILRGHVSMENKRHMRELKGVVFPNTPLEWSKDSQKHDLDPLADKKFY